MKFWRSIWSTLKQHLSLEILLAALLGLALGGGGSAVHTYLVNKKTSTNAVNIPASESASQTFTTDPGEASHPGKTDTDFTPKKILLTASAASAKEGGSVTLTVTLRDKYGLEASFSDHAQGIVIAGSDGFRCLLTIKAGAVRAGCAESNLKPGSITFTATGTGLSSGSATVSVAAAPAAPAPTSGDGGTTGGGTVPTVPPVDNTP